MTTTSNVSSSTLSDLGLSLQTATGSDSGELGQADFLELMTAQLQNQDPLNPLDNTDFLAQLAQFSTVQGIQTMNDSMTALTESLTSDQALQAASLVGHDVMVVSDVGYLPSGDTMDGAVYLSSSGDVTVEITDEAGQVIRTLDLGSQSAGLVDFSWDGLDADGDAVAEGTYNISARVTQGNTQSSATTLVSAAVRSVALNSDGLELELEGLSNVSFDDVYRIL